MEKQAVVDSIKIKDMTANPAPLGLYPPSQKATGFKTVDECEGGYPSKLIRSVVGYASEGSALRSMWRSHGL